MTAAKCGEIAPASECRLYMQHCTSILGKNYGSRRSSIHAYYGELLPLDLLSSARPWQLWLRSRRRPGNHPVRRIRQHGEPEKGLGLLGSDRILRKEDPV